MQVVAVAAPEKKPPLVTATLDFQKPDEKQADAFYTQLDANTGKAIELKLTIVPRTSDSDPGYTLKKGRIKDSRIVCGRNFYGTIDNYRSDYGLEFPHPAHNHAPTEIKIGTRQLAPFNGLRCGIKDYTEGNPTPLYVSGYFVVTSSPIPTANEYVLFPLRP
jgi:hypothetical protein